MELKEITIDGFRFVDNLHTTARQLPVLTKLISFLDSKQYHKRILEQLLIDWSNNEEVLNESYRFSKGKITNQKTKTSALRYHLELSPKLGLTTRFNDLYMNTKMSKAFLFLFENSDKEHQNIVEECFYTFQLLKLDGDGIILSLNQLHRFHGRNQKNLQIAFRDALNGRLLAKMELATESIKFTLSEKFRSINFIWKKPAKYAEHLIAPRYEWLSYLGLVKIDRPSSTAIYSLTRKGKEFYNKIPDVVSSAELKDVNEKWINEMFFSFLNDLGVKKRSLFYRLSKEQQELELGTSLEKSMSVMQSSMSFKLSLKETLFFICVDMYTNRSLVINYSDIVNRLSSGFTHLKKIYLLKTSGRSNEGYITITNQK